MPILVENERVHNHNGNYERVHNPNNPGACLPLLITSVCMLLVARKEEYSRKYCGSLQSAIQIRSNKSKLQLEAITMLD